MVSTREYRKLLKQEETEGRIREEAEWYLDHCSSVRDVAANFGISKSTVWSDFTKKLKDIDWDLSEQVRHLLYYNRIHAVDKMNKANEIRRLGR